MVDRFLLHTKTDGTTTNETERPGTTGGATDCTSVDGVGPSPNDKPSYGFCSNVVSDSWLFLKITGI